ncbi:uncharacterized protein CELE_F14F8.8 [Caenorhabditis elegans]|uniref:Secreted protein n=1 Tax=Caenorhabditis elegans TaxID=6239 RepID=Q9XU39_CAEEL|nr:Secreted protein [Caenorhabditis elegans]CAB07183.1 Secreted protein [Caenorhabditis elegans]|eukprot:NP_507219.1 Uncharacterized protein CELE_F14F8.8 [Caenorhabditis elegans]
MYAVLLVLALLATAQSGPAQTMPSSTTMTPVAGNSGNSGMQGANTMPMNATGMSNSNSMGPARTSSSTVMPGN